MTMRDTFVEADEVSKANKKVRTGMLASGLTFNPKTFEVNEGWVESKDFMTTHSTHEMVEMLKRDKKIQLEARVLGVKNGQKTYAKMGRDSFLENVKRRDSKHLRSVGNSFRESWDGFSSGSEGSEIIGKHDFTPLLGGPFNKQLYYRDYLRMISASFYALNHDPMAKAVSAITTDFTLGRGFQLHADDPAAQVIWDSFVEANNFNEQMEYFATELSAYGETMWWWLPGNQTRISFNPVQGEKVPTGLIPRLRLIDPSNFIEIITIPEDPVQGVLAYVWLAPTQYQMYTKDGQSSSKFIYTQIPAEQIMHVKVNCVSNEKRGRSDFFPALGYFKRLRDGVNYALVAQQKAAAWCIDTTIAGDVADIEEYIQYQQDQEDHNGVHTAGSEFVHTEAIKREYLANTATSKGGDSPVFAWCMNMGAMASGIPVSYFGTHLSGGSTRASALVSTEPVSKRFERRQTIYERTVRRIFNRVTGVFGIESGCQIVFPELITQDRSAMLKDLSLAQANYWISPRRCAEIANKEFDAKDFNYDNEMAEIKKDEYTLGVTLQPGGPIPNPLTAPAQDPQNTDKGSAITAPQKTKIKSNLRTL